MTTIVDILARQAEAWPDAPFLTEDGRSFGFAEFFTGARRYAGVLAEHGIGPGDRVVLFIDRRVPHLLAYFASMALGAIPVHVMPAKGWAGAVFAAAHTAAKLVITDVAHDAAALPCASLPPPDADDDTLPQRWPAQRHPTAYIMFTSGTTGEPKAALTTHENLLFVTRTLIGIPGMRNGDKEVIVLPLAATGGLGHVHANLMLGNHAIFQPGFFSDMTGSDLQHLLRTLEAEHITGFLATPGLLGKLVETHRDEFGHRARGLRYILANVTPIRPALTRDLIALLPDTRFYTYYGLTEASRSVYFCFNDHPERLRTAGRAAPGVAIRLAKPSPRAAVGEVLIKGGNVIAGYLHRPGLGFDDDGWFRTGDLGSFDEDGFLTIHGRMKDSIRVDGIECFPQEIEAVLEEHQAVKEAAVVAAPDPVTYERVVAFIRVTAAGEHARVTEAVDPQHLTGAVDPACLTGVVDHARPIGVVDHARLTGVVDPARLTEDLHALCARRLMLVKRPTQFLIVDTLPRVGAGKLDRAALRARVAATSAQAVPAALRTLPMQDGGSGDFTAASQVETPLPSAFVQFRDQWTPQRYQRFRSSLGDRLGVHYAINATPIFLDRARFQRLTETTEAILRFLHAPSYQAEIAAEPWFLPRDPVERRDSVGSVDFHLGPDDQAHVIEVNFFPPGFIGMLELVEAALFDAFDLAGFDKVNTGFEADLVNLVSAGGRHRRIAVAVSHLPASAPYIRHYRYVVDCFQRRGIDCRMVYAADVTPAADGTPCWDGERFDRVFTLVIPRVMEHDPAPFARFIEIFHRRPDIIFPRLFGWKLGMKRLLPDLHRLGPGDHGLDPRDLALIKAATLPACKLSDIAGAADLQRRFGGNAFVLKPFDNYDKAGVLVQPDADTIARVMATDRAHYVAQAWCAHPLMPVVSDRGETTSHQFSFRMGFLGGQCRGIRGASFRDSRTFRDYYAPVVLT